MAESKKPPKRRPTAPEDAVDSADALRRVLDAQGVGENVGRSMRAVRAIVLRQAAHLGDRPHVLAALDIIHIVADLASYLQLVTSSGEIVEYEPGRTLHEVRTVLTTMPGGEAGERLGLALRILDGSVTRDGNRTTVHAELVVRELLRLLVAQGDAYADASDDESKATVVKTTADLILERTGTRPPVAYVATALATMKRRAGRPKGSKNRIGEKKGAMKKRALLKDEALEQLLVSVGYDVANVYDYMPTSRGTRGARRKSKTEPGTSK